MITFHCQCGKTYQFEDQLVGRRVRCRCGQNITVSAPNKTQTQFPEYSQCASTTNFDDFTLLTLAEKGPQPAGLREYGNHQFVRELASGGMGRISIARDENLKREVALKELFESAANRTEVVQRFLDEAEITARLEHPGIIPVHAFGTDGQGTTVLHHEIGTGKNLSGSDCLLPHSAGQK